MESDHLFFNQ